MILVLKKPQTWRPEYEQCENQAYFPVLLLSVQQCKAMQSISYPARLVRPPRGERQHPRTCCSLDHGWYNLVDVATSISSVIPTINAQNPATRLIVLPADTHCFSPIFGDLKSSLQAHQGPEGNFCWMPSIK